MGLSLFGGSESTSNEEYNAYTDDYSRQQAVYGGGWMIGDNANVNIENSDYRVAVAGFDGIARVATASIDSSRYFGGRAFDLAEMAQAGNERLSGSISNLKAGVDTGSRTINNLLLVLAVGAMAYTVIKR